MNRTCRTSFRVALMLAALAFSGTSLAQATRTWVSGVGDDVNPCSRTAPCKTFAGAISKTAAGGEISVLDPGGFGTITITKAITIDGGGIEGSILSSGTNGVVINAGPTDVVYLRNLNINGGGTGLAGVRFLNGGALHVEDVSMTSFNGRGIEFLPSGGSELFVRNTTINRALGGGIGIIPGLAGSANATIENASLVNNTYGVRVEARSNVAINRSAISGNTNNGVLVYSITNTTYATVSDSIITGNGSDATSAGMKVEGAAAIGYIGNSTVTNNMVGLLSVNSGFLQSFGNNQVGGNGTDGIANQIIGTR